MTRFHDSVGNLMNVSTKEARFNGYTVNLVDMINETTNRTGVVPFKQDLEGTWPEFRKKLLSDLEAGTIPDYLSQWFDENVEKVVTTSRHVCSHLQFSDKIDCLARTKPAGRFAVLKFHFQHSMGSTIRWDRNWIRRLAGQARAVTEETGEPCGCVSVVFSSADMTKPVFRVWTDEEVMDGWIDCQSCVLHWLRMNQFNKEKSSVDNV